MGKLELIVTNYHPTAAPLGSAEILSLFQFIVSVSGPANSALIDLVSSSSRQRNCFNKPAVDRQS